MSEQRRFLVLAALVAATSLLGLFHQIQDIDPAQYAGVARRVAATGEWLDLFDARGPFINKPPMMIWTQALAMRVVPDVSAAARIPAVLFGVAVLAALFGLGRALFDVRTAAVAVALFAATPAFQLMIADPKVDMPLIAFTTAAVWAFVRGGRHVWLGWLFVGLAVLSKGPVALVLVGSALVPEWVRQRRLAQARPLSGLLIVCAVAAPFYLWLGAHHGEKAVWFLLWDAGPGRLFDASLVHDGTTPLFFFHTGLWALAPLSLPFVIALARRRGLQPMLVWWFAVPFVIISFSSIKMPQYVYWLGPPAALIAAREVLTWQSALRWAWPGLTLVAVLGLGAALLLWCFPSASWVLPVWVLACAALAFGMRSLGPAAVCTAVMGAFFVLFHGHVHGALLAYQAGEPLGRAILAADPSGKTVPYLGSPGQYSMGLYAERDVCEADPKSLREKIEAGITHTAVVTDEQLGVLRGAGWNVEPLKRVPSFRTSVPNRNFLRASTRDGVVTWLTAVRVTPPLN